MKKDAYRSYIQVRYNLGKTPQEVYCELKIHARSCSPSLSTIYRWFDRFRNGEKNLQDKHRPGRPITSKNHVLYFFQNNRSGHCTLF